MLLKQSGEVQVDFAGLVVELGYNKLKFPAFLEVETHKYGEACDLEEHI